MWLKIPKKLVEILLLSETSEMGMCVWCNCKVSTDVTKGITHWRNYPNYKRSRRTFSRQVIRLQDYLHPIVVNVGDFGNFGPSQMFRAIGIATSLLTKHIPVNV
jgi:hypothetical protein